MTTQDVKILACLAASPTASQVARGAKRLADMAGTSFEAVHVAAAGEEHAPQRVREALLQGFRAAETLGATTRTLNGDDAAAELLAYAHREHATHLVIGASYRPSWVEALAPSTFRRVICGAGDIVVEVCPPENKTVRARLAQTFAPPPLGEPIAYLVSSAFVGVASMVAVPLQRTLALPNISLIYVLAVIAAAARYGAAVAAFTAVLAALAYNFFLTEPYYSFEIYDPRNVWAVFFFLIVAIVVSSVASHTRAQTRIARRQAEQSAEMQAFAHTLVTSREPGDVAMSTVETISKLLYARAVVLAPGAEGLELIGETPGPEMLGADDMSAARYSFEHEQEAGRGAAAVADARWLFVPIPGERGPNGVLGARPFDDPTRLDPEQRRFLDLAADQAGIALDRARIAGPRIDTDRDEAAKRSLVASISHDLRTPLATIRGAVESLLLYGDKHDAQTQRALLEDAATQAQKLSGLVQNVLDIAQLDAGLVSPTHATTSVQELAGRAIDKARASLRGKKVKREIEDGLDAVQLDRALTEAALIQILQNAGEQSPEAGTILLRAAREGNDLVVNILDEGPGFSREALSQLFEKFGRGISGDGRPPGTGLGLAIARGLIAAQGGTIQASNRTDRSGAIVRISLPMSGAG